MKKTGHDIIDRIRSVTKPGEMDEFLEGLDVESTPTDPQEFLDMFRKQADQCTACILSENRTVVVGPDGDASAEIMVCLEGPGFLENLTGVPLVGPMELRGSRCGHCNNVYGCFKQRLLENPGQYGRKPVLVKCKPNITDKIVFDDKMFIRSTGAVIDGILLKEWKFAFPRHNWVTQYNTNNPDNPWPHKSPWFITNAVLCRSCDVTGLKDETPNGVPVSKCRKWLNWQWAAVQPKVIVAFGKASLATFIGESNAKSARPNQVFQSKYGPIIFQYHPAYYMREPNQEIRAYNYAKLKSTLELALEMAGYEIIKTVPASTTSSD